MFSVFLKGVCVQCFSQGCVCSVFFLKGCVFSVFLSMGCVFCVFLKGCFVSFSQGCPLAL